MNDTKLKNKIITSNKSIAQNNRFMTIAEIEGLILQNELDVQTKVKLDNNQIIALKTALNTMYEFEDILVMLNEYCSITESTINIIRQKISSIREENKND